MSPSKPARRIRLYPKASNPRRVDGGYLVTVGVGGAVQTSTFVIFVCRVQGRRSWRAELSDTSTAKPTKGYMRPNTAQAIIGRGPTLADAVESWRIRCCRNEYGDPVNDHAFDTLGYKAP